MVSKVPRSYVMIGSGVLESLMGLFKVVLRTSYTRGLVGNSVSTYEEVYFYLSTELTGPDSGFPL